MNKNLRSRYIEGPMTKTSSVWLIAVSIVASCKLGPFPDEPVEHPTAPEPNWGGVGKPAPEATDAGVYDAALDLAH